MTAPVKTAGVYLAAGFSKRMGSAKLNLPLGKHRLGSWALETALDSRLDHLIVVTHDGRYQPWLAPFTETDHQQRLQIITCKQAKKGQAHSLRCGLEALPKTVEAFMVILADQPFVTAEIFNRILDLWKKNSSLTNRPRFIATRHQNIPRPPVLFHVSCLPELLVLEGDAGARSLLQDEAGGTYIDVNDTTVVFDIDTPKDYEQARNIILMT